MKQPSRKPHENAATAHGWMLEGMSEHGRQAHQRECGWRKEAGGEHSENIEK
jgi:hypothetical protein